MGKGTKFVRVFAALMVIVTVGLSARTIAITTGTGICPGVFFDGFNLNITHHVSAIFSISHFGQLVSITSAILQLININCPCT
jgi:hypothetical protein